MKKIVFALMCVMTVFVLSSCSKSDGNSDEIAPDVEQRVGGEDVTDPFLNPGGKIIDKGVNIIGAWAVCEQTTPTKTRSFFLINSKGQIAHYSIPNMDIAELDVKGVLHYSQKDFFGWPADESANKWKTMIKALLGGHTSYPKKDNRYWDYNIDEKNGKFSFKYEHFLDNYHSETWLLECELKIIDIDKYALSAKYTEIINGDSAVFQKVYLRRVKAFQE